MDHLKKVKLSEIDITSGFWAERQKRNAEVTVYAVRDRYEETGRFGAFDFDYTEGSDKPRPHYFWDSDVAKWIESVAFILAKRPDETLRAQVELLIDKMEAHQDENGYLNIYHTVIEPDNRFRDRDHHELYCLGHLIEAGVAYYNAVGSDRLLKVLDRYIDYVIRVFTVEKSTGFTSPGHEEIELALYKLYETVPDEKYKKLADFFIEERGKDLIPLGGWCNAKYSQNHLPVREQRTVEGHCVRANYLYSGMADAARLNGDEAMLSACRALFGDETEKKMYITGGVGSSHHGEAFTVPFDLPNDTAYTETCAAIALAMFANRMKDIDIDSRYADAAERALYNGVLSGVSLDGRSFFYENPLEINLADHGRHTSVRDGDRLPITERQLNFSCSCCPPNITRLIADLGEYFCSYDETRVFVHQYASFTARFGGVGLEMQTDYPCSGRIALRVSGAAGKTLYLRIPGWCGAFTLNAPYRMEKGYAVLSVPADVFSAELTLAMEPVLTAARPEVRADAGRAALTFGPLVFCVEAADNNFILSDLRLPENASFSASFDPYFGAPTFTVQGSVTEDKDLRALYFPLKDLRQRRVTARFIPYFGFANRGPSDMRVWIRV